MRAAALLLAAALAGQAVAEAPRMLGDAEAPEFRAVGRLNVAGRRFCTATLISEREAATAAHCLYNPRTGRPVPLGELRFVAGLRRGELAAVRRITAVAVPDDFVLDEGPGLGGVRADVALLALAPPVAAREAAPLAAGAGPAPGDAVRIVSYVRNRPEAPSIQEDCRIGALVGGVAAVTCPINFGASGAPVLAGDAAELVAVVSAIGELANGDAVALAVPLAPRLAELRLTLDAARRDADPGIAR
jgi:hypothetical protein